MFTGVLCIRGYEFLVKTFVNAASPFRHLSHDIDKRSVRSLSAINDSVITLSLCRCWQTALLSSYFEIMYVLHIMMLGADIIIGRFTKLKV